MIVAVVVAVLGVADVSLNATVIVVGVIGPSIVLVVAGSSAKSEVLLEISNQINNININLEGLLISLDRNMRWTVRGLGGGPRRVNHSAVAVKDIVYSFGGNIQLFNFIS